MNKVLYVSPDTMSRLYENQKIIVGVRAEKNFWRGQLVDLRVQGQSDNQTCEIIEANYPDLSQHNPELSAYLTIKPIY